MFQGTKHGYHLHETYEVDGEAYHGTVHLLPVGLPGTQEKTYEAVVESGLLPLVEAQGNGTPALELIDRGLPLVAHPVEFLLGVYLVDGELVDPFPDLRFVVEDLTAEEPVLARGDKRRYLSGRTREHHREEGGVAFPVFVIGPSVEREPGMVESVTERIAPMPVITPDSGGDGIRLGLENDTGAVRIDDILQDTRPGIVAGDDKHTVFRHLGHLHLGFLLA